MGVKGCARVGKGCGLGCGVAEAWLWGWQGLLRVVKGAIFSCA